MALIIIIIIFDFQMVVIDYRLYIYGIDYIFPIMFHYCHHHHIIVTYIHIQKLFSDLYTIIITIITMVSAGYLI